MSISNVCKKASCQLNVLKRIGGHLCKLGKLNVYYSFVMSNFNYCPLTWHFCGEKKIQKRLRKYKKGPFGLYIEIMTLAMNHCF